MRDRLGARILNPAIDAIVSVAEFTTDHWDTLVELDINPLMVLPDGSGVVIADALIRMSLQEPEGEATP